MRPAEKIVSDLTPDGTAYSDSRTEGPALVFIHGVGMNKRVWQPQFAHFSQDYRVIAYDLPGHGGSVAPDPEPVLANYTAQFAGLLDHLDVPSAGIVGHSMGALVAISFALEHSRRALCLVALNAVFCRSPAQRRAVRERADTVLASRRIEDVEATLQRWFAGRNTPGDLEQIDTIRGYLRTAEPGGYGLAYRLFAESDTAFKDKLDGLSMPVLYMTGRDDPNSTPAMSKRMAALTPGGEAVILNDEAHMMAYISPAKVNAEIGRFLDAWLRQSRP